MKINKHFTIEFDVCKKLEQENNASGLIEDLLIKHYASASKSDEQIIQEVKAKITEQEHKEERAKNKLDNPFFIEIVGRSMTEPEYNDFDVLFNQGTMNILQYAESIKVKDNAKLTLS